MIELDEDALICDLAETYQIYDYKSLPLSVVAIFSAGLPETSRIKTRAHGLNYPLDIVLQSIMADTLRTLLWSKTKDAEQNINRPQPLLNLFMGEDIEKSNGIVAFDSPEELKAALAKYEE